MQPSRIEAWVLSVVDQVVKGQHVEDSRVELKSEWPAPHLAARRIAGHANASGGEPILWVIGLHEERGVVPVAAVELSNWWNQVAAEFDGIAPSCTDLRVPIGTSSLVALLFDTSRRPYVVKNPARGAQGAGPVALEVPWREGTAIRSARREDLLRVLVPLQALPSVEVLSASASARPQRGHTWGSGLPVQRSRRTKWNIRLTLYVTPRTSELLVLPVHRAALTFRMGDASEVAVNQLRLSPPSRRTRDGWMSDSQTVAATGGEAVLTGPGQLRAEGWYYEPSWRPLPSGTRLEVALSLLPAGQERSVDLRITLKPDQEEGEFKRSWILEHPPAGF